MFLLTIHHGKSISEMYLYYKYVCGTQQFLLAQSFQKVGQPFNLNLYHLAHPSVHNFLVAPLQHAPDHETS